MELENIAFKFISAETKMLLLLCPRHGEGCGDKDQVVFFGLNIDAEKVYNNMQHKSSDTEKRV